MTCKSTNCSIWTFTIHTTDMADKKYPHYKHATLVFRAVENWSGKRNCRVAWELKLHCSVDLGRQNVWTKIQGELELIE